MFGAFRQEKQVLDSSPLGSVQRRFEECQPNDPSASSNYINRFWNKKEKWNKSGTVRDLIGAIEHGHSDLQRYEFDVFIRFVLGASYQTESNRLYCSNVC